MICPSVVMEWVMDGEGDSTRNLDLDSASDTDDDLLEPPESTQQQGEIEGSGISVDWFTYQVFC